MNRREFIGACAFAAAAVQTHAAQVHVEINVDKTLGRIPADFTGLGYEISSVVTPGLLSSENRVYVELVRGLGAHGVIRVGGNTSDYASFDPAGRSRSAPKGTVVNEANLRELATFLNATGWNLIWGLNLGGGTQQEAVAEAQAVAGAAKDKLLAFEIGNEPDLFGRGAAHRPSSYGYDDYLKEYRSYKAAIRAQLPASQFAGPDAAGATDWVTRFAHDEAPDLKLLTHHYYRECAGPSSTIDKLLHPDPKLQPQLAQLKKASDSSGVPCRICEVNSFCGGGKPGVSDTFAAALWALDYMLKLAWAGASGINLETGVNQLGFISSYSPLGDDEHGSYSATPEYYGMLAFAQIGPGVKLDAAYIDGNLTVYPVAHDDDQLAVVIVNKDESMDAAVTINANRQFQDGHVLRLGAQSLAAKQGITLGNSSVSSDGAWKSGQIPEFKTQDREATVRVPAASAAIVKLLTA